MVKDSKPFEANRGRMDACHFKLNPLFERSINFYYTGHEYTRFHKGQALMMSLIVPTDSEVTKTDEDLADV